MITVHHLENSRSQRVLWLLEELGVPYELAPYKRDRKTMLAPPELKKVHPLGKSPVITDDGKTLAESAAILEYLAERYGNGKMIPPAGTPERLRYSYFMHYAEGSVMPQLLIKFIFETIKKKAPLLIRPIAKAIADKILVPMTNPNLKAHFEFIEKSLGESSFFAGEEISAADMQMLYPLEMGSMRTELGPKSKAWLERVKAREAYQRAEKRGGGLRPMGRD